MEYRHEGYEEGKGCSGLIVGLAIGLLGWAGLAWLVYVALT